MERVMLDVTWKDKKKNCWIREQTKLEDVILHTKRSKCRWAGHMARRKDGRWTRRLTLWRPRSGCRRRGGPNTRWEDELRAATEGRWRRRARKREEWREQGWI